MLYAVFGRPGSGKSYYVVEQFIVKRVVTNTIISNLKLAKGVELPNYNYLDKPSIDKLQGSIRAIMSNSETSHDEKCESLSKVFNKFGELDITYIVDECHLYGYKGRSPDTVYLDEFISIHRHIFGETGRTLDIVLITQVPSRLNLEISEQVDEAIIAIPAPQRVVSEFLEYKVYASVSALRRGEKELRLRSPRVRGREVIFDLYQSGFNFKGSNAFRKKLLMYIVIIVISSLYVINSFYGLIDGSRLPQTNKKINKPVSNNKKDEVVTGPSAMPEVPVIPSSVLPHEFICRECNLSVNEFKRKDIIMLNGLSHIVDGRVLKYCFWTDLQKKDKK